LNKYLWLFFDEPDFEIKEVEYTNWHRDPNFQGSFSFFKLTTNPNDFAVLSKPIDKRLWLIGEHTHPKLNGLAQGAYETGERAAK
jgi:monoamine oxidase